MWAKVLKEFFWLWWDNLSKNILVSIMGFLVNIPTLAIVMGLFIFMRVPFEVAPTYEELSYFWLIMAVLFGMSMFFPSQIALLGVVKRFATGGHKKFFAEFFEELKLTWKKSLLGTLVAPIVMFLGVFAIIFYISFFGADNIIGIVLAVITFWYLVVIVLFFVVLSVYIPFFPNDPLRVSIKRSWTIMMDNVFVVFLTVMMIVPIFVFNFVSAIGMLLLYQGLVNSLLVAMFVVILKKYKVIEDVEDNRTIRDIFRPF